MIKSVASSVCFLLIFFIVSCANKPIPSSIVVSKDSLFISLNDEGYSTVGWGSNIYGDWVIIPMEKHDFKWTLRVRNMQKKIEYKFLIDNLIWKEDPLNNERVKVPEPFEGYNSVLIIN